MIEETEGGVRLRVRVTPRASRTEAVGFDDAGLLRVRVAAPPVDGAANDALVKWFSRLLKCPRSAVHVVHGLSGRVKTIEIEAITAAALRAALNV